MAPWWRMSSVAMEFQRLFIFVLLLTRVEVVVKILTSGHKKRCFDRGCVRKWYRIAKTKCAFTLPRARPLITPSLLTTQCSGLSTSSCFSSCAAFVQKHTINHDVEEEKQIPRQGSHNQQAQGHQRKHGIAAYNPWSTCFYIALVTRADTKLAYQRRWEPPRLLFGHEP